MKKIIISLILCGVLFVQSSNVSAAVGIHYSMYGVGSKKGGQNSYRSVHRRQNQRVNVSVTARWNYYIDKYGKTQTKGSYSNLYIKIIDSKGKVNSQAEWKNVKRGGNDKYRSQYYKKIKIKKNDNYKIKLQAKCANSVFDGYGALTY